SPVHRLRDPKRRTKSKLNLETRYASSLPYESLPLAELEALTCSLLSILLTLFSASIAGEEAFHLQLFAQFDVELKQRAGNAHLERACLTVDSTAGNVGVDVKCRGGFAGDQRLLHLNALRFGQKILVQIAAVHLELAAAGTQENPGHARLAA